MESAEKSIRKFLIISLGLLSIVPLLLLSSVLLWDHYSSHKDQLKELQSLRADVAMQKIENYLDEQRVLLLSTIKATNILRLDRHDKENVLSMLLSSTVNREYGKVFQDLILLNEKGLEEVHVSRTEIFTQSDLRDLSLTHIYKIIMAGSTIHYEPVYFEKGTGEPLLIVALPVRDVRTDQVKAVLVAHIRMRYMWDVIAKVNVGKTGLAYIHNSEGRVIAHPNPSVVLRETYVGRDGDKVLATGLDGQPVVMAREAMLLGNEKYFIVTEVPVREALSHLRHFLVITGVLSLITLAAAMFLVVLLFRKIVKPVESLALTAQAISRGNFDEKANVSGSDELAFLADSFNFMTSTLLRNIKSLEENVEERKVIEDKLLLSIKEKEVLLREVHHRVKNNMQIINSLLNMQIKKMHDKRDMDMVRLSQMRIRSMSLIHEKLYKSESLALIDFKNYLSELVELLVNTYKGYSCNVNFELEVEEIFLDLDLAISCGFIINELLTNALKYAFPDRQKGTVFVGIRRAGDDYLEIIIKDDGVGISPDIDLKNIDSVGLSLVTMLGELQLGGKVELSRNKGTEFKITFKDRRCSPRKSA